MASRISTCFLSQGLCGLSQRHSNARFFASPSHRLLPASCGIRQRNFSSRSKRQTIKKVSPGRPPTVIVNGETDSENESIQNLATGNQEALSDSDLDSSDESNKKIDEEAIIDVENENAKESVDAGLPDKNNLDVIGGPEQQLSTLQLADLIGMLKSSEKNIVLLNRARIRAMDDLENIFSEKELLQRQISSLEMKLAETDARMRVAAQEKIHVDLLEDQLENLRNELMHEDGAEIAEPGTYVNQVYQLSAGLPSNQSSIDSLSVELKSLRVENNSLKDDIQMLRSEVSDVKRTDERIMILESQQSESNIDSLSEQLRFLRAENGSLKNDLQILKSELSSIRNTDERVMILEKERSDLQTALRNLESKLSGSREDISKLSTLKFEYEDLWGRVEDLQVLLDKATSQANQAFLELQKNQELRKKVSKLEESLEEANIYKLSSERLQQYNELMQQKVSLLEDRLQKSDEDIHSFLQLYQESVREFQDTLDTLKEESRRRSLDEPIDDMPWEFWSRLLLMIDGWLLEKKIPANDATLLREMVWKKDGRIYNAYMESKDKNERGTIASFLSLVSTTSTSPGLHVIHIAAEMAPVAKVGGLGDVVTGLSKALQRKGHLVEIVIPKYDCMEYDRVQDLRALDFLVESHFNGKLFKNKIWVGTVEGLAVYFIEPLHPEKFFWRGQFYGEQDDFKRFSYFSRAALELLLQAGKKPDIIHCHDWQTAFVAPLYWDLYAPKGLNSARICFTCHNFEYQGTAPAGELAACGLDVQQLNRPDRMQDNSAHDRINPVKGAIVFSNIVTTVSPTYAQEVRTAEGGKGLHTTLNLHSKKFVGILNGIDTDAWNPATDSFLEVQYSANDLQGKAENKKALRRQLGLSNASPRQPLVGCITRLVPQKGVHLIRHAIYRTLELGGQFVLLGSSPVPHIQREFEGIANQFHNHDHVRLILKYDESLSHSIYAATDMFIIPSIFEPCGLTQMIAMRYGSVPIARKTGGLNDSVFDVDDDIIPLQFRNGFTFTNADEQGLNGALERAFKHFENNTEKWEQLILKVMSIEFSWDSSASNYEELYSKSVVRARSSIQRL